MCSSRNSAHVNTRWLYVQWATVLTQILFRSKQLGYFCVRSHDSLRVVFTQLQKALRIVGSVPNPSCCSPVSLYSVCVCVHILGWCQVCCLYHWLVQTEISHISAARLIVAHAAHLKPLPAWYIFRKPQTETWASVGGVCCTTMCYPA